MDQRIQEISAGTDVIVMSLMQSAPAAVQVSDSELSSMLSTVSTVSVELSSSKLQQLMSIRNSPRSELVINMFVELSVLVMYLLHVEVYSKVCKTSHSTVLCCQICGTYY